MERDLELITVISQRAHLSESAVLAFDVTVGMAQLEIPRAQELPHPLDEWFYIHKPEFKLEIPS